MIWNTMRFLEFGMSVSPHSLHFIMNRSRWADFPWMVSILPVNVANRRRIPSGKWTIPEDNIIASGGWVGGYLSWETLTLTTPSDGGAVCLDRHLCNFPTLIFSLGYHRLGSISIYWEHTICALSNCLDRMTSGSSP